MNAKKLEYWVLPAAHDEEFAAAMEGVLDTYKQPYDEQHPVICMDEQAVQLIKATRSPIAATEQHPKRIDYEYERAGTAAVFIFNEPLTGWRDVQLRAQRGKLDWAVEMAQLLEGRYAECDKLTLVCDNLNTHTKGAFYRAFEPERARALAARVEFCYTPKHASWLNTAESELSAMTRQCLAKRRIGEVDVLRRETSAWATDINKRQRRVDWQMTTEDARIKLKHLYPNIKT